MSRLIEAMEYGDSRVIIIRIIAFILQDAILVFIRFIMLDFNDFISSSLYSIQHYLIIQPFDYFSPSFHLLPSLKTPALQDSPLLQPVSILLQYHSSFHEHYGHKAHLAPKINLSDSHQIFQ